MIWINYLQSATWNFRWQLGLCCCRKDKLFGQSLASRSHISQPTRNIWIERRSTLQCWSIRCRSSKSVSWGGGGGRRGQWRAPCTKIGYSERRAEKGPPPQPRALGWRKARFWLADDSGDEILDSDWLPRALGWRFGWHNTRFWLAAETSCVGSMY